MENSKQSAFPIPCEQAIGTGLTKREYFAGLAMQGILSNEGWGERLNQEGDSDNSLRTQIAKGAVRMADELLKELNNNSTTN